MTHHTLKGGYRQLVERLNRFPQGAPPSHLLYKILSLLFSEQEAELVSRLPLRPFTAAKAGRIWRVPEHQAQSILDRLSSRAILLDLHRNDRTCYVLPPPMAGFFEFSLMRLRTDVDQQLLSQLFYQYINVEDSFITDLFQGETQLGRIFVHEPALPAEATLILDYERASEVILNASHIAVGLCYCRHKMAHNNRACSAPMQNCMTFNMAAEPLIRHGVARKIDASEAIDLLQEAWSRNLVQCGDNVREGVNFICHCCSCCCEGLLAVRRLAMPHALYTTNFMPAVEVRACTGCGKCINVCPVEAMAVVSAHAYDDPWKRKAVVNESVCLGCGLCVRSCPEEAVRLTPRAQRVVTPVNTAHRLVLMAIERGKLADLIFDTRAYASHRVMGAVLGAIVKLPPVKRLLASKQMKSRYLERLLAGVEVDRFSQ